MLRKATGDRSFTSLKRLFLDAGAIEYPAFYSYAYPEPTGFATAPARPEAAFYSQELREFLLPYDAVRAAPSPDETLLGFLQAT